MSKVSIKTVTLLVVAILLLLPLLMACSSDGNEKTPGETAQPTVTNHPPTTTQPDLSPSAKKVEIAIGNLSDLTGSSAAALSVINAALDDLVRYFNEENLIPGVELKVITYDGQRNPAKDSPGYEWLRERGADVIFGALPNAPVTLKPLLERDHMVMFSLSSPEEGYVPPGYVFNLNISGKQALWPLLRWIAANDWDYQTKGPAKIGVAGWQENWQQNVAQGMEEYCDAHPGQFKFLGAYLNAFQPIWDTEVEQLKNADYVYVPSIGISIPTFIKQYRSAGYTAKFIGGDPQNAYVGLVTDGTGWDSVDGMLVSTPTRWFTEDAELTNLANDVMDRYHSPTEATNLRHNAGSYFGSFQQLYCALSAIAQTIKDKGADNFTSQALFETLQSFSLAVGDMMPWAFSDTKRTDWEYVGIYQWRADKKDVVRVTDEWFAVTDKP